MSVGKLKLLQLLYWSSPLSFKTRCEEFELPGIFHRVLFEEMSMRDNLPLEDEIEN